jgi:hypothetical protein
MVRWRRSPIATLISVAMVFVMWPTSVAIMTGPPCQWPKLATGERCSQLLVATMNLKLLYFLLVKFLLLYDMKYVKNLLVQIDTSATSSYTPAYTNIAIYFISTAYTIITMHTHKLLDPFLVINNHVYPISQHDHFRNSLNSCRMWRNYRNMWHLLHHVLPLEELTISGLKHKIN